MTEPHTLWLDPSFGASGDMVLATFLGLGVPVATVVDGLETLDLTGWSLDLEPTTRGTLSAWRANVSTAEQHHHRSWSSIDRLLADAGLPQPVAAGARATFARLGEVEAAIHRIPLDEVQFHEVGALDAIVDIVGAWLALDALDVAEVVVGPVGIGHGTVEAAHGTLPIPAPATAELLTGATVHPLDVAAETVTPTGAALLATMATRHGPMPAGQLSVVARGAGGRDPNHYPNVLSGFLLATTAHGATDAIQPPGLTSPVPVGDSTASRTTAFELTTNLDDVTGEFIGHLIGQCMDAGADDAWAVPIHMKKGRPATAFHVLCQGELFATIERLLFTQSGTLGIRARPVVKDVLPRQIRSVSVRGCSIRVKIGPNGAKPEYDDLIVAAAKLRTTLRELSYETLRVLEKTK